MSLECEALGENWRGPAFDLGHLGDPRSYCDLPGGRSTGQFDAETHDEELSAMTVSEHCNTPLPSSLEGHRMDASALERQEISAPGWCCAFNRELGSGSGAEMAALTVVRSRPNEDKSPSPT